MKSFDHLLCGVIAAGIMLTALPDRPSEWPLCPQPNTADDRALFWPLLDAPYPPRKRRDARDLHLLSKRIAAGFS